jgi:hypothetical protein
MVVELFILLYTAVEKVWKALQCFNRIWLVGILLYSQFYGDIYIGARSCFSGKVLNFVVSNGDIPIGV